MTKFQSRFDSSRENVGKIYRDLQLSNHDNFILNGDLTHEVTKSLVDDINKNIETRPFGERSFFITVIERKDLMMPRAIHRELRNTLYRPYPEDDTVVFWVDPPSNEIRFCWCLPHWSEMDNILNSFDLFNKDMVEQVRAWKRFDLYHFGFVKTPDGSNWTANPKWQDKKMPQPTSLSIN